MATYDTVVLSTTLRKRIPDIMSLALVFTGRMLKAVTSESCESSHDIARPRVSVIT